MIDDHVDGKPYGLDVLIRETFQNGGARRTVTWKTWSEGSRPNIAPSPRTC